MTDIAARLAPPSPDLAPWVRYYSMRWPLAHPATTRNAAAHFPAHPGATLHFAFEDETDESGSVLRVNDVRFAVSGPIHGPVSAELHLSCSYIAVSLRGGAWGDLARLPLPDLTDRVIDGPSLKCVSLSRDMPDLLAAQSMAERIAVIEGLLRRQLSLHDEVRHGGFCAKTVASLRSVMPTASPVACARTLGLSSRQFQRRFRAQFGIRPKTYQRLARFYAAIAHLQRLERQPDRTLATLADFAVVHGYFDHAHLVRDFRDFIGLSPLVLAERVDSGDPAYWPYRCRGASVCD